MLNERTPTLLLLADSLPDGNHVFDAIFEKSAIGAVCLLIALLACVIAWLCWQQLKTERKNHRDDCAAKDNIIANLNGKFHEEVSKSIAATLGLINRLEGLTVQIGENSQQGAEILDEMQSVKNGLRALGTAANIPSERMNID